MKIPPYYTKFFQRYDTLGYLASLNENGFCDVCRTGLVYTLNEEYVKIMFMPALASNLHMNLQTNPLMTVTVVSALTFEGYQFKGEYLSHEELNGNDKALNDSYLKGMTAVIKEVGFDLENVLSNKYSKQKVEAIVMKVKAIYEQTPKNGTGKNINQLNPES